MNPNGYILECTNCGARVDPRDHLNPGPCCTLLCPLCNHLLSQKTDLNN